MNICEAAQKTTISKDMIRYYEKLGLIKPQRKANGYRDFTEDDLNTLVLIRALSNSRIPLKSIRDAFQSGTVGSLMNILDDELQYVRTLQAQLRVQEIALELQRDCFQQCAEGGTPRLCHYPKRWILWREDLPQEQFYSEHQAIINAGDYFQYLACFEASLCEGRLEQQAYRLGLNLFSPHPGAEFLPEQDCLRVILRHSPGRVLQLSDIEDYVWQAAQHARRTAFRILCHQIFHRTGGTEECFVCVEILLGSS